MHPTAAKLREIQALEQIAERQAEILTKLAGIEATLADLKPSTAGSKPTKDK